MDQEYLKQKDIGFKEPCRNSDVQSILKTFILIVFSMFETEAIAGNSSFRVGFEAGNLVENQSLTGTQTLKTAYDAYLLYSLTKEGTFSLSLGHLYLNSIEPVTATTSALLKTFNPYFGFKFGFGPKQVANLSAGYIPYSQASYTQTGTATEVWTGTGFICKLSLQPRFTERLLGVLSLNYFSGTYKTKDTKDGTVTTATNFTRSLIVPTIGLQFNF